LGSAVAELLVEANPVPMERVGIRDEFCPTGRNVDTLLDSCGLSVVDIIHAAKKVFARKTGKLEAR
jgi:transketolase